MFVDYLPQKGVRSAQFLPSHDELPEGWTARFLPFNLEAIPVWGTESLSQTVRKDFLVTQVNAFTTFIPNPIFPNPSVRGAGGYVSMILYHNHGNKQLQVMEKQSLYAATAGNGAQPYYLKSPYLISAGDQLTLGVAAFMGGGNGIIGFPPVSLTDADYIGTSISMYFTLIGGEPRG